MAFIASFISILSGLLAIAAGLGMTVSNDIAHFLSITNLPLSYLCILSLVICILSGGYGIPRIQNVSKRQMQIGGRGNHQNMS